MGYHSTYNGELFAATLNLSGIPANAPTNVGVPLDELIELDGAVLRPGDVVPVGRTIHGDLAYVVEPERATLILKRREIARLAAALARDLSREAKSNLLKGEHNDALLYSLLEQAVPYFLLPRNDHTHLDWLKALEAVLDGRLDEVPTLR